MFSEHLVSTERCGQGHLSRSGSAALTQDANWHPYKPEHTIDFHRDMTSPEWRVLIGMLDDGNHWA